MGDGSHGNQVEDTRNGVVGESRGKARRARTPAYAGVASIENVIPAQAGIQDGNLCAGALPSQG
jgi:hypothetical protein